MAKTNEKNNILWTIAHFKGGDFKLIPNDIIVVDFIDQEIGSTVEITQNKLAFIDDKIITDANILKKIKVNATIIKQEKDDKIVVFKYRRRKNSCRKKGHRQDLTFIKIESIENK